MYLLRAVMAAFTLLVAASAAHAQTTQHTVVNGEPLSQQEIDWLIQIYGQVDEGRFWYDPVTGLYGPEGDAAIGQLMPGLGFGGPLEATASGGGDGSLTGIFINGREIHPKEQQFLATIFGQTIPGRYWVDAQGVGGQEGGPAIFNIAAAAQHAASNGLFENGVYGGGEYDSYYMPWIGAKPGTSVGRASDGCIYVSQGGYSNDFC